MTLLELLVVIAIILIILPALYLGISSLYATHGRTFARALAISNATSLLKESVRDIRGAVFSESGALPLASIATSSLILYSDTDFDGRVERIRYTLNGDSFLKYVIEPTATSSYPVSNEVIVRQVHNIMNASHGTPVFQYFSATSTEITTPSRILDVKRITVTLESEARKDRETGVAILRSSASIRNLKNTY